LDLVADGAYPTSSFKKSPRISHRKAFYFKVLERYSWKVMAGHPIFIASHNSIEKKVMAVYHMFIPSHNFLAKKVMADYPIFIASHNFLKFKGPKNEH